MNILGINCFMHDSSAALVSDGEIVAMAEEERFNRQKHTFEFPEQAVEFCLSRGSLGSLSDVDEIGYFWIPWRGLLNRAGIFIRNFPAYFNYASGRPSILRNMLGVKKLLRARYGFRGRIRYLDHHLTHACSAFYPSPFDKAAVMVFDGNGELLTSSGYSAGEGRLDRVYRLVYPHSLGLLYLCVTEYLGFEENSGEGKVMGLASYGKPLYYNKFRELVHFGEDGGYRLDLSYFDVHITRQHYVTRKFIDKFGPRLSKGVEPEQRHCDIAASLQKITEEAAFAHLRHLNRVTKMTNLCLNGGMALNSVMNGKILASTPFEKLFIFPAANDTGCSLGSALLIHHRIHKRGNRHRLFHPYFGPSFGEDAVKDALDREGEGLSWEKTADPSAAAAALLAEGKILAWFQDRMEIGPRALGNRSILADPRRAEMKDIINRRVKHREPFRPFAPSILEPDLSDYFETSDPAPYMLKVSPVRPEKRSVIPAVTHVDGSGRVQTVAEDVNPKYFRLIREFNRLTGVPVVLNTSFNIRGEPIVCTPEDAIYCFKKTNIDYLVLGDYLVSKSPGGKPSKAERG